MERVSTGSNTIQKSKEDRRSIKMAFKIVRNDITKMNTEAIVNPLGMTGRYQVQGSGSRICVR